MQRLLKISITKFGNKKGGESRRLVLEKMSKKTALWRFLTISVFAVAFALMEAAVVVYLRKLFGFDVGCLPPKPEILLNLGFIALLPPGTLILPDRFITQVELLREAATIIVLISIALLSAKTLKERLGIFLIAFSIWDIFYYVFLRLFVGWPRSLLDIDVFFLIPMPWVGPILTPVVIFTLLFLLGLYLYSNQIPFQIKESKILLTKQKIGKWMRKFYEKHPYIVVLTIIILASLLLNYIFLPYDIKWTGDTSWLTKFIATVRDALLIARNSLKR